MSRQRLELTGQKFGRLTVLSFSHMNSRGNSMWLCQCEDNNLVTVAGNSLRKNSTKSCGCLQIESAILANTTHGGHRTRLHTIWGGIKQRCTNSKDPDYNNYGGRGITVYDEWLHNFVAFRDWSLANGYQENLTLDRKDNDGNYEPKNCQWSTIANQQSNKRHPISNYEHEKLQLKVKQLELEIQELREQINVKSNYNSI